MGTIPPSSSIPLFCIALGVLSSLAGCKAPQAYGERNSLILRVDTAVWNAYRDGIEEALEPRIYTVRPERTFSVTAIDPLHPEWSRLRQWQQVLVFGTADDPVVTYLLKKKGVGVEPEPWAVVQLKDVWARGQVVTALVLPERVSAETLKTRLRELHELLDAEYREWVRHRMYVSGVNDSLIEALRVRGFSILLPEVYDYAIQDSFFLFRNAYPDPGTLIRSLLLTWVPSASSLPAPGALRAWREAIDEGFYRPPQDIAPQALRFDTMRVNGTVALEMRGVWQDRSDYPAAGPFIARAVPCPPQRRLYYIDAWLYAPGKDKYPYVIQLETLLDSFRCGA